MAYPVDSDPNQPDQPSVMDPWQGAGMPPPPPTNLPPLAGGDDMSPGRRRFLQRLSIAVGGIAALLVGVPSIALLLGQRKPPQKWRDVGGVDDFKEGTTTLVSYTNPAPMAWSGITGRTASWLRRKQGADFVAFSINCTHLGCPVRWLPTANLFMCPCHGGVYYADGQVASGPPPLPLPRYPVRVRNGRVQIRTSPVPVSAN